MITEPLKRNTEVYWKRGGSFSKGYFQELYHIPRPAGVEPLKAVKMRYNDEEYTLKPDEVYPSYAAMFKEKHKDILSELNGCFESMKSIAEALMVPYSRVLRVNKEAKELGIIHES